MNRNSLARRPQARAYSRVSRPETLTWCRREKFNRIMEVASLSASRIVKAVRLISVERMNVLYCPRVLGA